METKCHNAKVFLHYDFPTILMIEIIEYVTGVNNSDRFLKNSFCTMS